MIITLVATLTPAFSYAADEGESTDISPIVKLEAGYKNSAALLENGTLFMWGNNTYGQIGIDTGGENVLSPVQVPINGKIIDVQLRGMAVNAKNPGYALALTENGTLWEWGRSSAQPRRVLDHVVQFSGYLALLENGSVVEIEAADDLTYSVKKEWQIDGVSQLMSNESKDYGVLTNDGKVFTWGTHSRGELGLPVTFSWNDLRHGWVYDNSPSVTEPTQIASAGAFEDGNYVEKQPVFQKAIMDDFRSAFISDDGEFYFCGQDGDTGSYGWASCVIPTPYRIASGLKDVYMGANRILVKKDNNDVVCYGGLDLASDGVYAVLVPERTSEGPTDEFDLVMENCDLMAVGKEENEGFLLATKTSGSLWVRGDNTYGQLGIGNTESQDDWVRADEVLKAIYGEDYIIPGDVDTDGGRPEGEIYDAGQNTGTTYGLEMKWGEDAFCFENHADCFGQYDNKPHQYSTLADIFYPLKMDGALGNVSKCLYFYQSIFGVDHLQAMYKKYLEEGDKAFAENYTYAAMMTHLGVGFNGVDRAMMTKYTVTTPWSGSCYGMSTMMIMNYRGMLNKVDFLGGSDASSLYDLWIPQMKRVKVNMPLKDALGFYQSIAACSTYATKQDEFGAGTLKDQLYLMVTELQRNVKKNRTPMLISYTFVDDDSYLQNSDLSDDKKAFVSHAIVAYALETNNGPFIHDGKEYYYRVRTLDPNFLYKQDADIQEANKYCIYITKDCSEFYIPIHDAYQKSGDLDQGGECSINYIGTTGQPILNSLPASKLHYDVLDMASDIATVNGVPTSAGAGTFAGLEEKTFIPSGADPKMMLLLKKGTFPQVEITEDNDIIGYQNGDSVVYTTADKGSSMQFERQGVVLDNAGGEFTIDLTVNDTLDDIMDNNVVVTGEGERTVDVQATERSVVIDGEDLDDIQVQVGDNTVTIDDENIPVNENGHKAVELNLESADPDNPLDYEDHEYSISYILGYGDKLVYTGKVRHPKLEVVAFYEYELKAGTDYKVTWPKYSTKIGKYTATVKFLGKYANCPAWKVPYKIVPAKAAITKLTSKNKSITVKYGKVKGAKAYQIAIKKKGTTKWRYYKNIGYSKVTKTIKNLKKGKYYYVKVRAYKTVSGKNYCGAWSKIKRIKVRK